MQTSVFPEPLRLLQQALAYSASETARRQAAMDIIKAYCDYYHLQAAMDQMQQLQRSAHGIKYLEPATILLRHSQQLFCQFNLLLIEAVFVLNEGR